MVYYKDSNLKLEESNASRINNASNIQYTNNNRMINYYYYYYYFNR